MPSFNPFNQGLINRPGLDPLPPRVGEDAFDSLSGDPAFVVIPFGPDPIRWTQDPGT